MGRRLWWSQRLEGTFTSGFLINALAPGWTAEGIKLFGWCMLIGGILGFAIGLVVPGLRCWFGAC